VPQTVFDQGDLITSRLNLGVTPDDTTTATVTVQRPDGTAIAGLNTSAWAGMEKTVQWWATDDGTAAGTTTSSAGDWLAVWRVTGTGASVTAKVYPVRPLPSASSDRPPWAPFLSDVADHVPWLTVDTVTPGSQVYLGTFTGRTTPTDEQVQRTSTPPCRSSVPVWAPCPRACTGWRAVSLRSGPRRRWRWRSRATAPTWTPATGWPCGRHPT
jgi:hypothetical protein